MGQSISREDLEDIEKNLTKESLLKGAIFCAIFCIGIFIFANLNF